MKKQILVLILFLLTKTGLCQFNNSKFLQTPNSGSLGIYGVTEISPFTGLANISIPVFALTQGDIPLKADLKYFASGVKPENHPGWVGQNFSLDVGGVVTRKVNGGVDEVAVSNRANQDQYAYLYNYGTLSAADWSSSSFAHGYANNNSNDPDVAIPAPDEFMFTLPNGGAGSFFLNHEGKWKVKSAQGEKYLVSVDVNTQPIRLENVSNSGRYLDIKRLIYKIIITDASGTRFTFGNDPSSIEFIRGRSSGYFPNNEEVVANAWNLTRIESAKGSIVEFHYQRKENLYIQSVSYLHTVSYSISNYVNSNYGFSCSGNSVVPRSYGSQILTPTYLKEIRAKNFRVLFEILETVELKYAYDYDSFSSYGYDDLDYNNGSINPPGYNLDLTPPKWYKLNSVTVLDGEDIEKEKYTFNYNNNANERLFLKMFSKKNKNSDESIDHKFEYNNIPLPGYNSLKIDEWGYYNNKQWPSNPSGLTASSALAFLAPNSTVMEAGVLQKIIYPTGGYTEFKYEPNTYSLALEKVGNAVNVISKTGIGGGLRIRKITSYNGNGLNYSKEYFYTKNGQSGVSSGILAGNKKVYINYQIGNPVLGHIEQISNNTLSDLNYTNGRDVVYSEVKEVLADGSYNIFKYSNSETLAYRDEAPTNVYSDAYVARLVYPQQSYAKTSSYGSPILSHNSRVLERGQLINKKSFNSAGGLVYELYNEYRDDPERFNEYVRGFDIYGIQSGCSNGLVNERYFQAIKIYTYFPYLKRQTETTYNPGGLQPVTVVKNYNYNTEYRVLKEESQIDSKEQILRTTYRYPFEVIPSLPSNPADNQTYAQMVKRNELKPIESVNSVVKEGVELLKSVGVIRYVNTVVKNDDGLDKYVALPIIEYKMEAGQAIPKNNFTSYHTDAGENDFFDPLMKPVLTYEYNSSGNVNSIYNPVLGTSTNRNSMIWGYNNSFPVANVENAKATDIYYTGFEDSNGNSAELDSKTGRFSILNGFSKQLTGLTNGLYVLSFWKKIGNDWVFTEERDISVTGNLYQINLSGQLDELRFYPRDAKMTTYTFDPLVGMTSSTDHNNSTKYYEYDSFNRLEYVEDFSKKIIKQYKYNYTNNEGSFGAIISSSNFCKYSEQTITMSNYPLGGQIKWELPSGVWLTSGQGTPTIKILPEVSGSITIKVIVSKENFADETYSWVLNDATVYSTEDFIVGPNNVCGEAGFSVRDPEYYSGVTWRTSDNIVMYHYDENLQYAVPNFSKYSDPMGIGPYGWIEAALGCTVYRKEVGMFPNSNELFYTVMNQGLDYGGYVCNNSPTEIKLSWSQTIGDYLFNWLLPDGWTYHNGNSSSNGMHVFISPPPDHQPTGSGVFYVDVSSPACGPVFIVAFGFNYVPCGGAMRSATANGDQTKKTDSLNRVSMQISGLKLYNSEGLLVREGKGNSLNVFGLSAGKYELHMENGGSIVKKEYVIGAKSNLKKSK